jgi:AraC-like DNA-binding protein
VRDGVIARVQRQRPPPVPDPMTHLKRDPAPPSLTEVSRFSLSAGELSAFRAVNFSQRFPPHFHESFAIGVVESGTVTIRTHRGVWIAGAGAILAFAPREVHSAEAVSEGGYSYRMIYPSVEMMGELRGLRWREGTVPPFFRAPVVNDGQISREFLIAHHTLMENGVGSAAEASLSRSLKPLILRHGHAPNHGARSTEAEQAMVCRARTYLADRLSERVRLGPLAHECGVSPFHLIRVFQRVAGVPPYAYLVQLRVNRAQALLARGRSVADVAYSCGFSDQSHLTRTFKKVVGVPPGQYARQLGLAAA